MKPYTTIAKLESLEFTIFHEYHKTTPKGTLHYIKGDFIVHVCGVTEDEKTTPLYSAHMVPSDGTKRLICTTEKYLNLR